MKLYLVLGTILLYYAIYADGLAVMSVDFGSQFMKIAIVKPGVPMEVALNKESRRKTPTVISMRNGERLIGDPALVQSVKYPKISYQHLLDLLGKSHDNPQVLKFQKRYPYYNMGVDPETDTVYFNHDENTKFTPEELVAMLLEKAREIAADFAEQPINDMVITVPTFFNQAERRAMLRAGEMAGVNVLQLINDNSAVALNYGIFRRKEFNGTAQHYMFYDMGHSSTTATIVEYKVMKVKNPVTGILDSNPQLTIKGVGFDRNLGSGDFQFRLRDHLVELFNKNKKTKSVVRENQRSMAKLMKEAGRVMQVLSANTEHYAQIEGLLDDEDFRAKVTRDEFEEMCKDLFESVDEPVQEALSSSQVTLGEMKEIILMGAGTRVPKVQAHLQKAVGREELGKSINTDESAALGAVYQAAHLSKGFKVKLFAIRDATLYPIQVEFERTKKDESGVESTKTVKRTLFGRNNPYPQKKVMTFNKQYKDFSFVVNYGDMSHVSDSHMSTFGKTSLQKVDLEGIEAAHSKHSSESDPKGIKAHFRVDESGILTLDKVEFLFEKPAPPEGEEGKEEESTLSKLGSKISSLFGGGGKEETKDETVEDSKDEPKDKDKPSEGDKSTESGSEGKGEGQEPEGQKEEKSEDSTSDQKKEEDDKKSEEKPKEEKPAEKDEKKDDEKDKKDEKDAGKDKKEKSDDKKEEKKEEKDKKEKAPPKPTTIKEDIKVKTEIVDLKEPSGKSVRESRNKIEDLNKRDQEKLQLEKAQNELEAYIIDGQDKLYQEVYEKCSTEEQREQFRTKFSEASDWLYEQDQDTERSAYEDKLKELKKMMRALKERVKEYEERPKALDALKTVMNYSEGFLKTMKNYTGEDLPFTETEYNTLDKLINETREWNKTQMAEQLKTPDTEKPKVLVEDFGRKMHDLDREVKYLINKAKNYKPKKKEDKEANKTSSNDTEKDKEDTQADDDIEINADSEEEDDKKVEPPMPEEPEKDTKEPKEKEPKEKTENKKDQETAEEKEEKLQLDAGEKSEESKPKTEENKSNSKGKDGHDPDDEL